jgi:hypothetical protein
MYLSDVSSYILKTTAVSVIRMLFYQVCSCSVFFTNKYNLLEWRHWTRSQLFLPYQLIIKLYEIVSRLSDQTRDLVIGFIVLLNLITTSNYSGIANSHALHFNRTRTTSSVASLWAVW